MIGSLRGTVLERHGEGTTLIEVGGVGYLVTVTPRTLAELEPTSPAFCTYIITFVKMLKPYSDS